MKEVQRDATKTNSEYTRALQDNRKALQITLREEIPSLTFEQADDAAMTSVLEQPKPSAIEDMSVAPERIKTIQRDHERELERAKDQSQTRSRDNSPAPGR
jgi:hypothetical protein